LLVLCLGSLWQKSVTGTRSLGGSYFKFDGSLRYKNLKI
jgi:hypothetical protein